MEERVSSSRPGVWWMLTRVYHHLLRERPMRNVLPVPESSMAAADIDCWQDTCNRWNELQIEPATGPMDPVMADELEDLARETARLPDRTSPCLAMQGRGFQRVRRRRGDGNAHYYQYNFTVKGQKTQAAVREAAGLSRGWGVLVWRANFRRHIEIPGPAFTPR